MNNTMKFGLMAGMMLLSVLAVSGSASAYQIVGVGWEPGPCTGDIDFNCTKTVGGTTYFCDVALIGGYYCVGPPI